MIDTFLRHEFWLSLEYLPIAEQIGATWLFPLINSLHVLGICFMLGTLLMLDLRVAGIVAMRYSIAQLNRDFLPLIWLSFLLAIVTGVALFITRASAHVLNPAFQWKMLLMLIAAGNMIFFHYYHRQHQDSHTASSRLPAKLVVSGFLSLFLWVGVTLAGRWMGHIV